MGKDSFKISLNNLSVLILISSLVINVSCVTTPVTTTATATTTDTKSNSKMGDGVIIIFVFAILGVIICIMAKCMPYPGSMFMVIIGILQPLLVFIIIWFSPKESDKKADEETDYYLMVKIIFYVFISLFWLVASLLGCCSKSSENQYAQRQDIGFNVLEDIYNKNKSSDAHERALKRFNEREKRTGGGQNKNNLEDRKFNKFSAEFTNIREKQLHDNLHRKLKNPREAFDINERYTEEAHDLLHKKRQREEDGHNMHDQDHKIIITQKPKFLVPEGNIDLHGGSTETDPRYVHPNQTSDQESRRKLDMELEMEELGRRTMNLNIQHDDDDSFKNPEEPVFQISENNSINFDQSVRMNAIEDLNNSSYNNSRIQQNSNRVGPQFGSSGIYQSKHLSDDDL